jgi:hypothetical protein
MENGLGVFDFGKVKVNRKKTERDYNFSPVMDEVDLG